MSRRLGPEETKYWLLGQKNPFNIVLACGVEDWRPPEDLALPGIVAGADGLPRWSPPLSNGKLETLEGSWILVAQALLRAPVGVADAPPWRLSTVTQESGTVVLLALAHALADARGGLVLLERILAGKPMPIQPPSFEELLATTAFADTDVQEEVHGWWSRRLTERLRTLDLPALAGLLPHAGPARLEVAELEASRFTALAARCRAEQTTLHGALVAALEDSVALAGLGHAVDMRRYLEGPLADEAWFALSHLKTGLPGPGNFWDRARQARRLVREALAAGAAGAALAELPRTLAAATVRPADPSPLTVSNMGKAALPAGPHGRAIWYMALAGANAGAPVLAVSGAGPGLMLASVTQGDQPPLPLAALVDRLDQAASA